MEKKIAYASSLAFLPFVILLIYFKLAIAKDTIVITARDIAKMNVRKIWDVLNQVPGISAGESFVSIRGSNKVKVFLDGRPINDPTSPFRAIRFDLVSLEDVKRIEIYIGRGALKYGANTSGGVILIFTKKGKRLSGNVKSYLGNFDTSHISANLRTGSSSFNAGMSFGYEYTGGYLPNNDKRKKRFGVKFDYVKDKTKLSFSFDYTSKKKGIYGRKEYPTLHYRRKSNMYSYSFGFKRKKVKSLFFLNSAKTENRDPERNIYNFLKVRKLGEDTFFNLELKKWGNLVFGNSFRLDRAKSKSFGSKQEYSIAFFETYEFLLFKKISFSFGIRETIYSEYEDQINPEIKISYADKRWSLSFTYMRTNNIPTFYQKYEKTSSKEPNPDLDIEVSDNLSLSFFMKPSSNLSLGLSFFHNKISKRITYVYDRNRWIGHYENLGKVTYKGVDVSLDLRITENISVKTNYLYIEAIDESSGNWIPGKPRHKIYSDFFFNPIKDISLVFNVKFESKQYTRSDNKASVPARAIYGLRIEYTPCWIKKKTEFFMEMKNLLDEEYCYGDGYPAPPFMCFFGVNFSF